ncbi:MAG TPA: hypothetical protein VK186_17445, partial [Candidatus Deferrimicrobium sp.]|nr:hypothetical protein [Candidatus Deferrimicrobium sp.]
MKKIAFIIPPAGKLAGRYLAPTMSAAILAALTPDHYQAQVQDGNVREIDVNCGCDLAALTVSTTAAREAFKLA